MAEKGTAANPIEAVYVTDVHVTDPDSGLPIELEVWKDPVSGGLLAIDASFVERVGEVITSPFNAHQYLHLVESAIERRYDANVVELAGKG